MAIFCFRMKFSQGDLYCCVECSKKNIEMRPSKLFIKVMLKKQMARFGVEHKLHDIKYFVVGLFYIFLKFIKTLRALSKKLFKNHQLNVILILLFEQNLSSYLLNISHLHNTCSIF